MGATIAGTYAKQWLGSITSTVEYRIRNLIPPVFIAHSFPSVRLYFLLDPDHYCFFCGVVRIAPFCDFLFLFLCFSISPMSIEYYIA